MPEITDYASIRDQLKTGDIVLFSGRGTISNIVKLGTLSKWSHCGLVLKLPEYDFLTVWESTSLSSHVDLESLRPRKGVQLVPLSDRVHHYSGDISIRQLNGPSLGPDATLKLMELRQALRGKRYELGKIELMLAAFDGPFGYNFEDLSTIFCSELVAEAYQCLGLLSDAKPSNEYIPADFSAKKMSDLEGGYSLGEEIMVKDH